MARALTDFARLPGWLDTCSDPPNRAGLFEDLKDNDKFEASGITDYRGMYVMVFDNSHTLGVMDEHLNYRGNNNFLRGEGEDESQYEAVCVRTRTGEQ